MKITVQMAADMLLEKDNIVILAHRKPDGDTLGASFGLLYALLSIGKTARVECADGYPLRYNFIFGDYVPAAFTPELVVAADVASAGLLGSLAETYPRVDLCIDHHKSNTLFAGATLLDPSSPAATQIMYGVITAMGILPDRLVADALFTGLSTDTGCFRFGSVTAATHRVAAELIACGARHRLINKLMFDTKSRGRLEVERVMLDTLSYHFDGRCAMISLPADIREQFSVTEAELDGISAFARRIEGVLVGITIRAQENGEFRISLRSENPVDSSAICAVFGGGGHTNAAGCTLTGALDDVTAKLLDAVGGALAALDL